MDRAIKVHAYFDGDFIAFSMQRMWIFSQDSLLKSKTESDAIWPFELLYGIARSKMQTNYVELEPFDLCKYIPDGRLPYLHFLPSSMCTLWLK